MACRLRVASGMRLLLVTALAAVALLAAACATPTRVIQMGPLPGGDRLVTVVVSEDRSVVSHECINIPSMGPVLGCHVWRRIMVPGTGPVQLVKIVRYTDAMPSPLSLEIDVHEICHAIAALQPIDDPCHADNGGVIESAARAAIR
jgi:hypothetical protein